MQLRAASAHLRRRTNLVFDPFGMTADQYVLLTVLARGGEASQEELARRCYSDTATIGAMVLLLERKRLLTRAPHPADGRAWRVGLTPSGFALADQMRRASSALRRSLGRLFPETRVRELIADLGRLAEALQPPGRKDHAPERPARIGPSRKARRKP
jgi:DNA-binding MarR family transcriptional regulator